MSYSGHLWAVSVLPLCRDAVGVLYSTADWAGTVSLFKRLPLRAKDLHLLKYCKIFYSSCN